MEKPWMVPNACGEAFTSQPIPSMPGAGRRIKFFPGGEAPSTNWNVTVHKEATIWDSLPHMVYFAFLHHQQQTAMTFWGKRIHAC